eukprot:TRINITY_DN2747_c0_g1_i20.p1 TRINITY_DN2747_c0_g1~~TRINITY_DN2747_c0_g1_i20.p1  ORF type:complete len:189 (+),score=27.56 TRINITY_DN2747_c0_g1_i20:115-681(+)
MSLWRTSAGFGHIPAKSVHYQSNGFGRDRYISANSGGLMQPEETITAFSIGTSFLTLGTFPRERPYFVISPRMNPKNVHYHSDGTGRDSYVGLSAGAHESAIPGSYKASFYHTLRSWKPANPWAQYSAGKTRRLPALQASPAIAKRLDERKRRAVYIQSMVRRLSMPKKVNEFKDVLQETAVSFASKE